jgi:hypothetical protein
MAAGESPHGGRAGDSAARSSLTTEQMDVAAPVFGGGGVAVAAIELGLPDLRADRDMAKMALAVATRSPSRELMVDRAHLRQAGLRLLSDPVIGAAAPAAGS